MPLKLAPDWAGADDVHECQKGFLPPGYANYPNPNGSGTVYVNWATILMNTMDGSMGFTSQDSGASGTNTSKLREAFFCPEVGNVDKDKNEMAVVHLLSNPRVMPQMDQDDKYKTSVLGVLAGSAAAKPTQMKITQISNTSEIIAVFDGSLVPNANGGMKPLNSVPVGAAIDAYRWYYDTYLTTDYSLPGLASYVNAGASIDLNPSSGNMAFFNTDTDQNASNFRFRHRGNKACNALFLDGHAEEFLLKNRTQSEIKRGMIYVTAPRK